MNVERMFPEANCMQLEMNHPKMDVNFMKLRDALQLTEAETTELRKQHTTMLTGVVQPHEAASVHSAITTGLTHQPVTPEQEDERAQRYEEERVATMEEGRREHTWAWDAVFGRAKQIVADKPGLVKLLKQAGMENDPRFWLSVARQARLQLMKDGKLR